MCILEWDADGNRILFRCILPHLEVRAQLRWPLGRKGGRIVMEVKRAGPAEAMRGQQGELQWKET